MREGGIIVGVIRVRIWKSGEERWIVMEMWGGDLFDRRRGRED